MHFKYLLSLGSFALIMAFALPVPVSAQDETTPDAESEASAPSPAASGFRFRDRAEVRDERKGQFYVAAFGGITFSPEIDDPDLDISGPLGGLAETQSLFLDGDGSEAFVGIKIGYETSGYQPQGVDFLVIRPAIEFEFSYAPQTATGTSSIVSPTFTSLGTTTLSQDIDIFSFLINPIARFQLFERYTPYVGGGFGASILEADAPSGTFGGTEAFGTGSDEEIAITLQAIAGFEVDLAYGFAIFTEYKFQYFRDISFTYANTTLGSSTTINFPELTRHAITGGVKYKF